VTEKSAVREVFDAQVHPGLTYAARSAKLGRTRVLDPKAPPYDSEATAKLAYELVLAGMDAVGVTKALIHGGSSIAELLALTEYSEALAAVPKVAPPSKETAEVVERLVATPGVVGLRLLPGFPFDGSELERFASGIEYDPIFHELNRCGLTVCLYIPDNVDLATPYIVKYPDLRFVVDHVGLHSPPSGPKDPGPTIFEEFPKVLALAKYPNVAIKFSGFPSLSARPYPFEDLLPYFSQLVDSFTPQRLIWGSDFTRCAPLHSYAESIQFVRESSIVSEVDKVAMLRTSMQEWFKWPLSM
jgi:L-fuconolactonase